MRKQHPAIAQYESQQIVEVVRDASGQPSDGFQFLGLLKLCLYRLIVSDIAAYAGPAGNLTLGIRQHCAVPCDQAATAVSRQNCAFIVTNPPRTRTCGFESGSERLSFLG